MPVYYEFPKEAPTLTSAFWLTKFVQEMFRKYDSNGDGIITRKALEAWYMPVDQWLLGTLHFKDDAECGFFCDPQEEDRNKAQVLHPFKRASGLFAGRTSSRSSALGLSSRTREIVKRCFSAGTKYVGPVGIFSPPLDLCSLLGSFWAVISGFTSL